MTKLLYLAFKFLGKVLTKVLFSLEVEGRENVPVRGPFIVAANHTSFLDVVVIQSAIPRKISWITKKDVYEKRGLRILHRVFESIPVNGSVERAIEFIEKGRVVGIFPEGVRSADGRLKNADDGVAILALRSGRPVLPVGIKGAFEAYPPGRKFLRPHPITMRIGKPLNFNKVNQDSIEDGMLVETRDIIMAGIARLIG